MRVLLVNSNQWLYPLPVMPLGLCALAASLEAAGHELRLLDLCFSRHPARDLEQALTRFSPQVVGLSVRNLDTCGGAQSVFLLERVREQVVVPLRRLFKGPLVLGGPALGINPREILTYLGADYAIVGDGEQAMVELLARLQDGRPLAGLPGLTHRLPGGELESNPPWRVADLDSLPPAQPERWLDLKAYRRFGSPLQIQTKRGCALKCSYCTYARIEGPTYRLRDPQRVAMDLERLVAATGIRAVEIVDSTFNLPLEHAKQVLRAIVARGLTLRLSTMGLNPAGLDRELVELMRRAGLREVSLGAEAACPETLRGLGKNFTPEDIERAGGLLRQAGLPVNWYLLLGGPGESRRTLQATMEAVGRAASPWDLIIATVGLRIYNGSPLAAGLGSGQAPASPDNFLTPQVYAPQAVSLAEIDQYLREQAGRMPNLLISNHCHSYPPLVIRLNHLLAKLIFPGKPDWRMYILGRRLAQGLKRLWPRRAGA